MRILVLLALALAAEPSVQSPLPFDHRAHEETLRAAGVTCVSCHPVGLTATDGPPPELPAPVSSCHACHLGEVKKAPHDAPRTCLDCHTDFDLLLPASHGPTWGTAHAVDARALRADCQDCHERSECQDCHAERGPVTQNPHPPGFQRLHGVEARLDPMQCSSCHAQATCDSCHATGVRPW